MPTYSRLCKLCQTPFKAARIDQKWCSSKCGMRAWHIKHPPEHHDTRCKHCRRVLYWNGTCRKYCDDICRETAREIRITSDPIRKEHRRLRKLKTQRIRDLKNPRTEYKLKRLLREKYGLTLEQFNKMVEDQNGLCAICGSPETAKHNRGKGKVRRLSIDHNHVTEKIRGLLCSNCNHMIGSARESLPILKAAIDYLSFWSGHSRE
jgi:recombination endonuclease VII